MEIRSFVCKTGLVILGMIGLIASTTAAQDPADAAQAKTAKAKPTGAGKAKNGKTGDPAPAKAAPPADGTPAKAAPPADGTPAKAAPPADGTPAKAAPPADGTPAKAAPPPADGTPAKDAPPADGTPAKAAPPPADGTPAKAPSGQTVTPPAALKQTLVIEKIEHHLSPRTGTWSMYVEITRAGISESEQTFRNNNNGPIPSVVQLGLDLDGVAAGEVCQFKVFLDNNFDQVGANAENRAVGSFKATRRGQKSFRYTKDKGLGNYHNVAYDYSPDVSWHFTIYWHLE